MKIRRPTGIHAIELVSVLMVVLPILLYGIDYACVLWGGHMNTQYCTAACRAAANGPCSAMNVNPNLWPRARAAQALKNAPSKPGAAIKVYQTFRLAEQVQSFPKPPFGGPVVGAVSVKTRTDVYPPFQLPFVSPSIKLMTTETYPFTYMLQTTYNVSGNGAVNPGGAGAAGDPGDISADIANGAP